MTQKNLLMNWLLLVVAGLFEMAWSFGLKYTDRFRRPLPTLLTTAGIFANLTFLTVAMRTLPIGTAYAVWVGIGALGAAIIGIVLLGEPVTPNRLFFWGLLFIVLVGLKLSSSPTARCSKPSTIRRKPGCVR